MLRLIIGFAAEFKQSAWCDPEKPFTEREWKLAKRLMGEMGPVTDHTLNVHVHSQTTAVVAGVLTDRLNALYAEAALPVLNRYKMMSLALVHDLGRFGTHDVYINDLLCQEVLSELDVALEHRLIIGFPDSCFSAAEYLTYLSNWKLGTDCLSKFDQRCIDDQFLVLMTADMLSKVDLHLNRLSSLDEAIAYHESSRGKFEYGPNRSGFKLFGRMQQLWRKHHVMEEYAKVYRGIQSWLGHIGISPDDVQREATQIRNIVPKAEKPIMVFDLSEDAFLHSSGTSLVHDYVSKVKGEGYTVVALADTCDGHADKTRALGIEGAFESAFFRRDSGIIVDGFNEHRALWMVCVAHYVGPGQICVVSDRSACTAAAAHAGASTSSWSRDADIEVQPHPVEKPNSRFGAQTQISVSALSTQIQEMFLEGKTGAPDGGGDRIILGARYIGVVDAATDKSGARWQLNGRLLTGEVVLAELLSQALTHSSDEIPEILARVQSEMKTLASRSGVDLTEYGASPLASIVVIDTHKGDLVTLGDCVHGFVINQNLRATYNHKRVDDLAAESRALVYLAAKASGAGSIDPDPGRSAILDELKIATRLANADPASFDSNARLFGEPMRELVYRALDIVTPPAVSRIKIPDDAEEVILGSDGYPQICKTLAETESYLEQSLREDPLRIGAYPSTKGLIAGQKSFDDRAYIRMSVSRGKR